MDKRNPGQISVNRISTLSLEKIHQLGLEHREKNQQDQKYYGFAQLSVEQCRGIGCDVLKDDCNGKQPYHANIVYEYKNQKDQADIAGKLAQKSCFLPYPKC